MEQAIQLVVLGVLAAVLAQIVQTRGFGSFLTLAVCVLAGVAAMQALRPLLAFARRLQQSVGLEYSLLAPLWKVLAITMVSRMGAEICRDAGQKALGELVGRGGEILALCAALPLMEAVLSLLQTLMGGGT